MTTHQIGNQLLETDTDLSAAESPDIGKTSTPKIANSKSNTLTEQMDSSESGEDVDDDSDEDYVQPGDNNEEVDSDEEDNAGVDDKEEGSKEGSHEDDSGNEAVAEGETF